MGCKINKLKSLKVAKLINEVVVKDGGKEVDESFCKYISDIVWDAEGNGTVDGEGCCEDVKCR